MINDLTGRLFVVRIPVLLRESDLMCWYVQKKDRRGRNIAEGRVFAAKASLGLWELATVCVNVVCAKLRNNDNTRRPFLHVGFGS